MDCVFCAVNNKVRTYARGKLMSNHKDLEKSFACGRDLLTLAVRGPGGHVGRHSGVAELLDNRQRMHRTHNN